MRHEQNAMEIQIRKQFILNVERLGMSQKLLDKYFYRHIHREKNDMQANGTVRQRESMKIYI